MLYTKSHDYCGHQKFTSTHYLPQTNKANVVLCFIARHGLSSEWCCGRGSISHDTRTGKTTCPCYCGERRKGLFSNRTLCPSPPPSLPPYLPFPLISSPSCYQHLNFFEYVCVRYHGTGTLVGDLLAEMKRKPEPPVPQSN